ILFQWSFELFWRSDYDPIRIVASIGRRGLRRSCLRVPDTELAQRIGNLLTRNFLVSIDDIARDIFQWRQRECREPCEIEKAQIRDNGALFRRKTFLQTAIAILGAHQFQGEVDNAAIKFAWLG